MANRFSCCSAYRVQCSNEMQCLNPIPGAKENCNYWKYNLSKGISFYGSKDTHTDIVHRNKTIKENTKTKAAEQLSMF